MKKIVLLGIFMLTISFSSAAEITFSPENGSLASECLITADVMVNTDNKEVSATDLIIESSLEFVDFVPTTVFPYYLPPKTKTNITHIVGFTVEPTTRVNTTGSIGTLYFKQQNTGSRDAVIKLYFKNTGYTADSNLSMAGGIDILDNVGSAYYTFVANTGVCVHYVGEIIEGGIANKSLDEMMGKIKRDQWMKKIFSRKTGVIIVGLLFIMIVLFVYYKKSKKGKIK